MHPFSELATRCAALTQSLLDEKRARLLVELQDHGSTALVKSSQALELQGAVMVVGMAAMFDAALQDALDCENGFQQALKIIEEACEPHLSARFRDVQLAVNVLKHGKGRSYEELLARRDQLPFRIRLEDEFFSEGDVSQLTTLVQTDADFLKYCSETIDLVAVVIKKMQPSAWA
ncbi:hypothetical protein [Xanthomonas campestris]|uniref:hypothetical protein n=1 Tax=Xanthomonas campestris TaxID=339 RepID=UPI0012901BAC|nr:hypothetical protein [Xanthomonas campestris]